MKSGRWYAGLALLCFPVLSHAEDWQFTTSAAVNFKTGEYIPDLDPDSGFQFDVVTLDLGFTLYTSKYYVTLNHDSTIKEDFTIANGGTIEAEMTRRDYGVTAGYNIGSGFGVFFGYKFGETEQESVRTNGATAFTIAFEDVGPFVGVSYGYNFGKPGSISASLAYADFDGEIRRKNELTSVSQKTGGKTSGLSYGVKWTREIREGTTIAVGYKWHDYQFDDQDNGFGASQDLDQTFKTIYVQWSDYFD